MYVVSLGGWRVRGEMYMMAKSELRDDGGKTLSQFGNGEANALLQASLCAEMRPIYMSIRGGSWYATALKGNTGADIVLMRRKVPGCSWCRHYHHHHHAVNVVQEYAITFCVTFFSFSYPSIRSFVRFPGAFPTCGGVHSALIVKGTPSSLASFAACAMLATDKTHSPSRKGENIC